jgi:hypothetical protein
MNSKSISDFASWFATITAFVLACIGIFAQPSTLETSRPQIPKGDDKRKDEEKQPDEQRRAELWDDPFAVFKPTQQLRNANEDLSFNSRALLLVVLTNIGPYEDDTESRLRDRYAIESALRDTGYICETPGELREVSVCLDHTQSEIPVEEFRQRIVQIGEQKQGKNPFCFVEVAWLPENCLSRSSLGGLCSLLKGAQPGLAPAYKNCELCVIGPTNSNTLAQMCGAEDAPMNLSAPEKPTTYPRILNFQATAAPPFVKLFWFEEHNADEFFNKPLDDILAKLSPGPKVRGEGAIATSDVLSTQDGTIIERVGVDDFDLSKKLVEEIDRRTQTTGWGSRRVLLISEWDTLYGRAAGLAFQLAAADVRREELVKAAIYGKSPTHFEIESFNYMRGLDGTATLYTNSYPSAPSLVGQEKHKIEPAEGVSQFDYIRRLSASIGRPVNVFSPTFREPDAIVLLGTDVYDKLTLLKLLRARFTRSLYLTTDLDALYWSSEYVRYTKNMIVAAPFPMEVPDVSARSVVLPLEGVTEKPTRTPAAGESQTSRFLGKVVFRDSYQTALYLSAVFAVEAKRVPHWAKQPRVFEIGNTMPAVLDDSFLTKVMAPSIWQGFFEGVNGWVSISFQTLMAIVAVIFLARLRAIRFEQRCFPIEYYSNLQSQLPNDFYNPIEQFRKIVNDVAAWSSSCIPNKKSLKNIHDRLHSLQELVDCISVDDPTARIRKGQLLSALDKLRRKLSSGRSTNLCQLRQLRVKPWWIGEVVIPLVRPLESKQGEFVQEIEEFAKYTRPQKFSRNLMYKIIIATAFLWFGIYFWFNRNFEGIVGAELRDQPLRWYRVIISTAGIALMVAVVVSTSVEQLRCKHLIDKLLSVVGEHSGLRDREIISVIAEKSNQVALLTWKPCILIFLFYVGHLRSFAGPPFDLSHWVLFLGCLTCVCVSFVILSSTARTSRQKVLSQYEIENLTAKRISARLASVVKDDQPLQDDLASTATLLNELAARNSSLGWQAPRVKIGSCDLTSDTVRKAVLLYLDSIIKRNEQILKGVEDLRSGALSPFAITSILGALLVPVGGVGGLTLLDNIVNQVR